MSTEAVSSPSPARWARILLASYWPAAMPRLFSQPLGIPARVEAARRRAGPAGSAPGRRACRAAPSRTRPSGSGRPKPSRTARAAAIQLTAQVRLWVTGSGKPAAATVVFGEVEPLQRQRLVGGRGGPAGGWCSRCRCAAAPLAAQQRGAEDEGGEQRHQCASLPRPGGVSQLLHLVVPPIWWGCGEARFRCRRGQGRRHST